ncbi:MAG: GldG family protein, partial [Proteobacteria bacterium]|nr:GldG family protein [Pseudomonadota bacterium]
MQKSAQSYLGIVILGLLLLLINSVSDAVFGRFYLDLTEDRLYTLSSGSRNIIKQIPDVITLKAYISKTDAAKYPAIKMYGDRIINLLKEYQRVAQGKIKLELYDPRPDTDEETWAQKFGITPLAFTETEKMYFGLVAINGQGDEELLPVFSLTRQEYLEYDISRAISTLSIGSKPVIGLLSSLKMSGTNPALAQMGQPAESEWVFLNQLSKFGEVETLPTEVSSIDPKIKVLLLVHPKKLSQTTLYAIDQFVLRGGNLFVAIDPYCGADQP